MATHSLFNKWAADVSLKSTLFPLIKKGTDLFSKSQHFISLVNTQIIQFLELFSSNVDLNPSFLEATV